MMSSTAATASTRPVFGYALSEATVSLAASGLLVVSGPDGQDTVRGIEQFQFSDRMIDTADGNPWSTTCTTS